MKMFSRKISCLLAFFSLSISSMAQPVGDLKTIATDATHFTFLGVQEASLSDRGLRPLESGGYRYWIPK